MIVPIVLACNATSWDERHDRLVPGGQGDRYLRPILDALPDGRAVIARQPRQGAVNALMNHRGIYQPVTHEHASVLISHGIASKGYRNADAVEGFTCTTAPGPALRDEIVTSGVPRDLVHVVGYPKLDPIHNGQVASPWHERDGRTRVLYAPTHGGGSERHAAGNPDAPGAGATTWWARDELLALLDPERHLVMEAPHPRHSPGRQATLAQYVGADVVIADGGSTMYEAWCCGLPVVFADWLTAHRNLTRQGGTLLEHRVYANPVGWHAPTPDQFARLVATAAAEGISDSEQQFAAEVLPLDLRGHGGKLHAELLLSLADQPRQPTVRSIAVTEPVRFISARYPNLVIDTRSIGIRFHDGVFVARTPTQIQLLNSPQWRRHGVRLATDADLAPNSAPGLEPKEPAGQDEPAPEPEGESAKAAELPPAADRVPDGSIADILAWVVDDPDRAQQATEAEQARPKPRASLLTQLGRITPMARRVAGTANATLPDLTAGDVTTTQEDSDG